MCGIAGIINKKGVPPDELALKTAAALLENRGPDDSGVWVEDNAGLAHQRLSILDVSPAGHQPMLSGDGRFVIVYNGEIYNFREIREKIDADPGRWKSSSDTEVVLAAYAKWGTGCLEHFSGMFAFAIWDRHEKRLFAARDRLGVKPFYYHHGAGSFVFASRPRALFAAYPQLSREIDGQALRYFLECGYMPGEHSIYRDIRRLPPAHYIVFDGAGLRLERYWDFRHIETEMSWEGREEDDLLDELDEIVSRSVEARMISDVPLGAFLSGGIDSSLAVAMMGRHSSQPVETFTIGFREADYDESADADAVARHLKTNHHCEFLSVSDLLELMPVFLREYDEPFFDYSAFPVMAISRLARKHVTVSLSGDGGDELFGGYHYYRIVNGLKPLFGLPEPARKLISAGIGILPDHRMKLLAAAADQKDILSAFAFSRSIAKDFPGIINSDVADKTTGISGLFADAADAFPDNLKEAERAMRLDAFLTLPDDYLQKVDVASMAFSLESREPLLDHRLVEWAAKLPLSWKIRGKTNKYLLRKLAYRYVPERILDRPKKGFGVPMESWLRGPLKGWAEERLHDARLFANLPLDRNAVLSMWEIHQSERRNVHPLLWAMLVLLEFNVGNQACAS